MAKLRIELYGEPGSEVELDHQDFSIGRDGTNDLQIVAPWLSRFHARICFRQGQHHLEDLGSRNGTYLNGGRLSARLPLKDGDWITLGDLQVFYTGEDSSSGGSGIEPPLPRHSTILLRSQDLTFERYPQQEAQTEIASGDQGSLLPALHSAASALISNYPPQELKELVLRLACEAVSAERGALLLKPRRSEVSIRRELPKIPRPGARSEPETGRDDDSDRVITYRSSDVGTTELGPEQLSPEELRQAAADRSKPGPLGLAAARGYSDQGEIRISRTILRQVLEQEKAVLTLDAQADERFGAAVSIQLEGIRSIICVPLWNNREVIGVLYLDHRMSGRMFSASDLRLVGLIANMAAVKIENLYLVEDLIVKKRLEEQLEVGAKIQRLLLPARSPELDGYDIYGFNRSCYEVGGDYYDFLPKENGSLAVVVADVAGKGVGAALLMAVLQASVRSLVQTAEAPEALVEKLNRVLVESSPDNKFATLFYGEIDSEAHTLRYVNAGHLPPGMLCRNGELELLNPGGPAVGMVSDLVFESQVVDLPPGARLLLCTDGVTELSSPSGSEFGRKRLMELICRLGPMESEELAHHLQDELETFRGEKEFTDDRTVVVVTRSGEPAAG